MSSKSIKKIYLYKKNIDKGYVTVYLCVDGMFILDSNNYMIKSIKKILIYKFDLINFFRTFESLDYKLSCYLNCYHAFNNQFFLRKFPTLRCRTHYNTRFEMIVILNDSY